MEGIEDSGIGKIPLDAKSVERAEFRNKQIEDMEKMFPIDSMVNIWRESKKKLEGEWRVGEHSLDDDTDEAYVKVFKGFGENQDIRKISLKDLMEYNGIGKAN